MKSIAVVRVQSDDDGNMSDTAEILDPVEAYDRAADHYDGWSWQGFWHEHEAPVVREAVAGLSGAMLDVGCGTGYYLKQFEGQFESLSGVDPSDAMLGIARARVPHARLLNADAYATPFANSEYDVLLSCRVLTHVASLDRCFREFRRVLRPGGSVVMSNLSPTPIYGHTRLPVDAGTVYAASVKHDLPRVLQVACNAGLEPSKLWTVGNHGEVTADADPQSCPDDWICWVARLTAR